MHGALFLIQITIVGRFVCMVIVQTENAIWHILHYVLQKKANVLVPDLRAHGKSSGNKIGMGWLDRLDLLSWISEVLAIDMEAEIILVGGSMGAATVMMASGEKLPTNVRGLIVDCGYTSVYDEFKYVLHESFHLPAFPILTIANQLALNNYGFQLKTASSVRQLHKNTLPTFLFTVQVIALFQ